MLVVKTAEIKCIYDTRLKQHKAVPTESPSFKVLEPEDWKQNDVDKV